MYIFGHSNIRRLVNEHKLKLQQKQKKSSGGKLWGRVLRPPEPKHEEAFIWIRYLRGPLQASDLTILLQQPSGCRLTDLTVIGKFQIEGDFSSVVDSLSNGNHLKGVDLPLGDLSQEKIVDLLQVLSNHRNLESIKLHFRNSDAQMGSHSLPENLTSLVEQPKALERIHIESFLAPQTQDENGVSMVRRFLDACFANSKLTNLSILPTRTGSGLPPQLAASLLRLPRTLKELSLRVTDGWNFSNLGKTLTEEFALSSLIIQRRRVQVPGALIEEEADAFRQCLEKNPNIKHLDLGWNHQDLTSLSGKGQEDIRRMNFLIKINYKKCVANPNDDNSWMQMISDEDDPSFIYHYLRKHPLLCVPRENPQPTWNRVVVNRMCGVKRKVSDYLEGGGLFHSRKKRALNFAAGAAVGAAMVMASQVSRDWTHQLVSSAGTN